MDTQASNTTQGSDIDNASQVAAIRDFQKMFCESEIIDSMAYSFERAIQNASREGRNTQGILESYLKLSLLATPTELGRAFFTNILLKYASIKHPELATKYWSYYDNYDMNDPVEIHKAGFIKIIFKER